MVAWMFSFLSYPIVSTVAKSDLGISNTQSGLVTAIFSLAYAAMQIPAGYFVFRYGSARMLSISILVMGLSPLLLVFSGNYFSALVSRLIGGIAGGIVWLASIRILSSWFAPNELESATKFFGVAGGAAQVVSLLLMPIMISGTYWRTPLIFTFGICMVAVVLTVPVNRWISSTPSAPSARGEGTIRIGLKVDIRGLFSRNMFALTLPNFASRLVSNGILAWALTFLLLIRGLSNTVAGEILGLIGIGSIVGSYVGGVSSARVGKRVTIGTSVALLGITPFLFGFSNSVLSAAMLIFAIGFSSMLFFSADFALIPFAAKQGLPVAGLTFGIFNTLSNIGSFLSPVLIGYVLDRTGSFSLGFGITGAMALVGLIGVLTLTSETPQNGKLM